MLIPLFWAKGKHGDFTGHGWSMTSMEEAQSRANQAAKRIADRFHATDVEFDLQNYPYGAVDAIRELCVERFDDPDGRNIAALTRNHYGAVVLNTKHLMMVDVDIDLMEKKPNLFQQIFRIKPKQISEDHASKLVADALAPLDAWFAANPDTSVRVYRTRAGLRYLFVDQPRLANDSATVPMLQRLGSDPYYVRLCKSQKCYRARLTPKFWRCGLPAIKVAYPFPSDRFRQRFEKWDQQYREVSQGYATCKLLKHVGTGTIDAQLEPFVKLHDEMTRIDRDLPLA